MMAFAETRAEFYGDFTTAATYTPAGGGSGVSVEGIFDADYVEPFGQVEGKQIAMRFWAADFAARPTKGAQLLIGATTYRIKNVQDIPPNAQELRLMLEIN